MKITSLWAFVILDINCISSQVKHIFKSTHFHLFNHFWCWGPKNLKEKKTIPLLPHIWTRQICYVVGHFISSQHLQRNRYWKQLYTWKNFFVLRDVSFWMFCAENLWNLYLADIQNSTGWVSKQPALTGPALRRRWTTGPPVHSNPNYSIIPCLHLVLIYLGTSLLSLTSLIYNLTGFLKLV